MLGRQLTIQAQQVSVCSNKQQSAAAVQTWNMAGGAVDALKVPDGLAGLREVVCQETTAVFPVKDAGEAPLMALQRTQV